MAPFKFKLQQVLEYRTQLEDQAKLALAEVQAKYQKQVQRVDGLRKALADNQELMSTTTDPAQTWIIRNFLQGVRQDISTAEHRLLTLAQELNSARQVLTEKAQEKKLLEKLKENQAKRHAHEEKIKEQLQLDETATLRFKPQAF
ncbi:flagellar export protein FliJ [Halodesulfovibrio sp.]|jgi:flagellar FliJ protein|uniref:flagellar export protein FliJ n=1 Tax=Halodesulfovibrio sp. TaxID=1912772 RepID=UPI0025E01BBF|nr:flagellar export protein FliJ [Halodesulfovibrio sp.]MCT4534636.1 flagellar export protein FliJ [Halodesulfovibrio sp.]MCT4628226.1 flagellar export protein FliJ [Halodesulfovibrio sp.]